MSEQDRPNGQNGEWQPTREFYLANPRSAQIRSVCIEILHDFDALIHDPKAQAEARRASLYRRLFGLDTRLTELGIYSDIHEDLDECELEREPVLMTEFVAGIIGQEIGREVVTAEEARPLVEEFSISRDGQVFCLDMNQPLPRKLKEFLEIEYLVFWGYQTLAISPSEKPVFSLR